MRTGTRRRAAAVTACAIAVTVAACGPPLPNSVVADSSVAVGWSERLTSTNAAAERSATSGNLDIAAMTRSQFAEPVEDGFELDESFGEVAIADPEPDSFTVRYDLTEPQWSDGIPVDAADLLLAWAAGSNALAPEDFDPEDNRGDDGTVQVPANVAWFDSMPSDLARSEEIPQIDEFARWMDVRFTEPVTGWRTALNVAVPAHVVGERAFDVSDPMEAKQAVITAIQERDTTALAAISSVWNDGFDLGDGDGSGIPEDALLSSGPYRVTQVDQSVGDAQRVHLEVNREYTGREMPEFERVELVRTSSSSPVTDVGNSVNVVQVQPTSGNREPVRELERRDYGFSASHDGTVWALVLRSDNGEFTSKRAREAFLRAVPREDVVAQAAGPWATEYGSTDSLLFPRGTDGYDISRQDAGFDGAFDGSVGDEAIEERRAAGVPDGALICALYDTGDEFASAAFEALKAGVREAGWDVIDCGQDDAQSVAEDSDHWHAYIARIPVPTTPDDVFEYWGTDGASALTGTKSDERDRLIEQLRHTPDEYEARDLRVQIEASIVDDAIALPLSVNPIVALSDRTVEGVELRAGPAAPLTSRVFEWGLAEE